MRFCKSEPAQTPYLFGNTPLNFLSVGSLGYATETYIICFIIIVKKQYF